MVFALCLMLGNQVSSPRCSDTMTMKPDVTVEWHGQVKHNNMKNHQAFQSLIFSWVFGLTLDKFPWGSAVGATMRLYHKGLSAWRVEVGVKYTAEQSVDETDETGYNNNLLCIGCRTWQWTRKGDREASFYQIMGPSFEYRTKKVVNTHICMFAASDRSIRVFCLLLRSTIQVTCKPKVSIQTLRLGYVRVNMGKLYLYLDCKSGSSC